MLEKNLQKLDRTVAARETEIMQIAGLITETVPNLDTLKAKIESIPDDLNVLRGKLQNIPDTFLTESQIHQILGSETEKKWEGIINQRINFRGPRNLFGAETAEKSTGKKGKRTRKNSKSAPYIAQREKRSGTHVRKVHQSSEGKIRRSRATQTPTESSQQQRKPATPNPSIGARGNRILQEIARLR